MNRTKFKQAMAAGNWPAGRELAKQTSRQLVRHKDNVKSLKRNSVLLGYQPANQQQVRLSYKDFMTHVYFLSSSGHGKSCELDVINRQWLRSGLGMTVIENHGDVTENLRSAAILRGYEDKVVDFDFNQSDFVVGLNPLEFEASTEPEAEQKAADAAARTLSQIAAVFDQEKIIDSMPSLSRWLLNMLFCLAKNGLTLAHAPRFLNDTHWRRQVVEATNNPLMKMEWEEKFDKYPARLKADLETPVINRFMKFCLNPQTRRIICQKKSTFSPLKAMNEGQIVLVNLSGLQDPLARRLVGKFLIEMYYQQCQQRDPLTRLRPHLLQIDEFDEFVLTSTIGLFLAKTRKFKLSVCLSHQSMQSLLAKPEILAQIKSNVKTWLVGSGSREDAEEITKHFFTGAFRADIPKDEIYQTKFRPVETTRKVTTKTQGEAVGRGEATGHNQARTRGNVDSEGLTKMKQKGTNWAHTTGTHSAESDFDSDMTMDSMADMMGNSSNTGIVYLGGEPYNLEQGDTNYMVGQGFSSGQVHNTGHASGSGSGYITGSSEADSEGGSESRGLAKSKAQAKVNLRTEGQSHSKSKFRSKSRTRGEAVVPFHELHEFQELSNREYFKPSDIMEHCTALIFNLPHRHFLLKVARNKPQMITTPDVRTIRLHPELEEYGRLKILKNCSRPVAEADQEFYQVYGQHNGRPHSFAVEPQAGVYNNNNGGVPQEDTFFED